MKNIKITSLFILMFVLLCCIETGVAAVETGSFISSVGTSESFWYSNTYSNNFDLEYIVFYEVNYYQNIQNIQVRNIPITMANFTTDSLSKQTDITIDEGGDVIGTGTIGYGKDIEAGNFTLYIYLDSWDIGSRTGETSMNITYNEDALGIDYFKRWGPSNQQTSDEELALQFAPGVINRELPYDYVIVHTTEFQNDYRGETFGSIYRVNITKVIGGSSYTSFIRVTTPLQTYINGSSSIDESVLVGEAPIFIYCNDTYDNVYTATLFDDVSSASMYGVVMDLTNGTGISSAEIVLDGGVYNDTSGAGGAYLIDDIGVGEYNVNVTKSGYQPRNFTVSFEYPSVFNIDIGMMPTSITHDNGAIVGFVTSTPYNDPVEGATVYVSNTTYSTTTTTTANGYYIVSGLGSDTYDVYVSKSGYDTTSTEQVVVTEPDFTTQDFIMNQKYKITVTAADISTGASIENFTAIINGVKKGSFGGEVVFFNIEYGWIDIDVNASGYYAATKSIYVDDDKEVLVHLQKQEGSGVKYEAHYVGFRIVNWYYRGIEGVNISVGGVGSNFTGSDGIATFELEQNINYSITLTKDTYTKSIYIMPLYNEYIIVLTHMGKAPPQDTKNWYDFVDFNVTTEEINSTHAWVNLTYVDILGATSNLYVYVNDSADVNLQNAGGNLSVVVNSTMGSSFYVGFNCDYVGYDSLAVKKVVVFPWNLGEDSAISEYTKELMSIAFLILLGAVFGTLTIKYGAIILPLFALILNWVGWFTIVNDTTTIMVCMTGLVLAIMLYMRSGEDEI